MEYTRREDSVLLQKNVKLGRKTLYGDSHYKIPFVQRLRNRDQTTNPYARLLVRAN